MCLTEPERSFGICGSTMPMNKLSELTAPMTFVTPLSLTIGTTGRLVHDAIIATVLEERSTGAIKMSTAISARNFKMNISQPPCPLKGSQASQPSAQHCHGAQI